MKPDSAEKKRPLLHADELAAQSDHLVIALLPIFAAVGMLIIICWLKGERPRRRRKK